MTVETADQTLTVIARLRSADRLKQRLLLLALGALASGAALLSLFTGPVPVAPGDVIAAIFGAGGSEATSGDTGAIITAIRLPRIVLGLCVGAVLGVCGAALQGLFRNPLADPGIIGVSSGAALAAALVIVVGGNLAAVSQGAVMLHALPLAAFTGSLAAMLCVLALARRNGAVSGITLLLAGIAINALAAAVIGFLTFISTDEQLRTLTFWTLGSLGGADWTGTLVALVLTVAAAGLLLTTGRQLNAYMLGEREAGHLGVPVERLKRIVVVACALGVGSAVAVSGIIGFLGLVAPHIVRLAAGSDHRVVLPASALLGAFILCVADMLARTVVAPAELPVGILTSAIGAPFFLWLLIRYKRVLLP